MKNLFPWCLGAALCVAIAGCGGGTSPQRPVASADAGEILVSVERLIQGNSGNPRDVRTERDLFSVGSDGSNRTPIPTGGSNEPFRPKWLPGRRELVYTDAFFGPQGGAGSIRRANRDGTQDREIVPAEFPNVPAPIAVSPDGRRIAYGVSSEVRVAGADGSDLRRVADGSEPLWSPDGRRLVVSFFGEDRTTFRVVNADGTGLGPMIQGSAPSWSADGRRLVFHDQVGSEVFLFVINADGSNRKRVTTSSQNEFDPRFSPDGRRIVYVASLPGSDAKREVFTVDADGSNSKQISTNTQDPFGPKWTPDGRRVVFISLVGADSALFSVDADGSNQRQIFSATGRFFDFDLR